MDYRENDMERSPLLAEDETVQREKSGFVGAEAAGSSKGITGTLILSILLSVLGGTFQFGYNTGVINQPESVIRGDLSGCNSTEIRDETCTNHAVSSLEWSVVVSIFAIGGLVGGVAVGWVVRRLGPRMTFVINNMIFIAGSLFMACATNVIMLAVGRFLIGVGSGVSTGVTPIYLTDIAPISIRGGVGTFNQVGITVGILISQLMGVHSALSKVFLWRILLGFSLVPAALQTLLIFFLPESPRWLLSARADREKSKRSLQRLRGTSNVEAEMSQLEKENEADSATVSFAEFFASRQFVIPLALGVLLQASQQLSGINAIFYFSTSIFSDAHVSNQDLATAMTGVVNVLMTFAVVFLIDRAGRRTLLVGGLGGMVVAYAVLTIALFNEDASEAVRYLAVVAVMLVIVGFAIGPGAIAWIMIAEMFPASVSSIAVGICVGANWIFNFVVGISFTSLQESLGHYTFIPFTVLCACFALSIFLLVPETKGRSVDEITASFKRK